MLLNAGYFPTTYFAASHWNNLYWPAYGTYIPPMGQRKVKGLLLGVY